MLRKGSMLSCKNEALNGRESSDESRRFEKDFREARSFGGSAAFRSPGLAVATGTQGCRLCRWVNSVTHRYPDDRRSRASGCCDSGWSGDLGHGIRLGSQLASFCQTAAQRACFSYIECFNLKNEGGSIYEVSNRNGTGLSHAATGFRVRR